MKFGDLEEVILNNILNNINLDVPVAVEGTATLVSGLLQEVEDMKSDSQMLLSIAIVRTINGIADSYVENGLNIIIL